MYSMYEVMKSKLVRGKRDRKQNEETNLNTSN